VALARAIAAGGADAVQYREKRPTDTCARVETARRMRVALGDGATRLVVNDRVDVAVAAGAAGVHLGPRDLGAFTARRILGEGALIGATANDLERALEAAGEPIDYLGVGPVFGTRSKSRPAPVLGIEGLRRIVRAVDLPVIAIGGITVDRVAEVLEAGARGVAVLSDAVGRADPAERVARFVEILDRARREHREPAAR
jgi:thiamine-phosphate diphosphorylase